LFCNLAVYRASFRLTFAEVHAPTGEWKSIMAGVLFALSISAWMIIYVRKVGKITRICLHSDFLNVSTGFLITQFCRIKFLINPHQIDANLCKSSALCVWLTLISDCAKYYHSTEIAMVEISYGMLTCYFLYCMHFSEALAADGLVSKGKR